MQPCTNQHLSLVVDLSRFDTVDSLIDSNYGSNWIKFSVIQPNLPLFGAYFPSRESHPYIVYLLSAIAPSSVLARILIVTLTWIMGTPNDRSLGDLLCISGILFARSLYKTESRRRRNLSPSSLYFRRRQRIGFFSSLCLLIGYDSIDAVVYTNWRNHGGSTEFGYWARAYEYCWGAGCGGVGTFWLQAGIETWLGFTAQFWYLVLYYSKLLIFYWFDLWMVKKFWSSRQAFLNKNQRFL